jgi:hypothetical protein
MRALTRLITVVYYILLGGKALVLLSAGLLFLLFAGLLVQICDGYLLIAPIIVGGSGILWIMQALEPFAGKRPQPKQPPQSIMPPRSDRTDPRRRHPARQNY